MGKTIDLGYVLEIHSQITDAERYRLLTSEGPRNVLFLDTIRQNRRKFLKSWLQDDSFSNWLVYTQLSGGGGLCKTCILMQAHLTHGSLANAAFVKKPCINFKKFVEKALFHRDAAYHREVTLAAKNFISSMECGKDIYTCIAAGRAKRTAENKKISTSIVKTVVFCASNNIPLRGHSADKGNFMKLLQFRMDAGDEALKKHLAQMAGNAKYTSPTIQNQILGIASTMVVEEIVAQANESFISVVADESCNISGKEQLSLVLRYTKDDKVNESFTGFVEISSVSAESISAAILAHLSRIGVDLRKLVGQGYDGASTMAGHVSGVQKRIRKKYPRAIFVHCAAHCLNLVINDQSRVSIVRSTCDIIRETICFFRESPKRR